ncbi:MAG: dienelactone hydrolase family protein [Motiliproteus sp.]|nr:dienelactone hydrolase family protein [Motiliproteus sp.]
MKELLPCIELEPEKSAVASVIWLHGLGADGNDFVPVVPELQLPEDLAVRFIFPHAPVRPVTINGGMPMRAWYDILSMGNSREIEDQHLYDAQQQIDALIERELERGVASENIILIGFSQGGAVAYQTALRYGQRLAGLACLSTYRISPERSENRCQPWNRELPVFVAHGEWDPVVPVGLGREGYESLSSDGIQAEWHSYPMEHEVCLEEIRTLGAWLAARLSG